jgi:2-methylisocitrate lyase-like PEP mutase family enzyme
MVIPGFQQHAMAREKNWSNVGCSRLHEDKLFPKTNSFITSERQPLATTDEFTGKIKAVKDAQGSRLCLVARLEDSCGLGFR